MKVFNFRLTQQRVQGLLCCILMWSTNANSQSLEQAVAFTLDNNPELRTTYTHFKVSEQQIEQAKSGYLPTVNLTGGIGYEHTDSPSTRRSDDGDTEDLMRRELGISLKQNLFTGFQTSSDVKRTSSATIAAQWQLSTAAEDLALEVSKVYVNLIKAKKLVGLSEKNLRSHEDIYQQIKQRTSSGFSSRADLSQINGRLASAHSNLIAANNNYLDSKTAFYRIVGQAPENLVIPYPDSSFLPKNKEEGLKQALISNPVITSSMNDINAANYQYEAAKSTFYPKVSLELSANFNDNLSGEDGSSADVGGENNDVQAMIRFSYNIFSGGKDKAYAKETAYKVNQAKALNRNVYRQVTEGFTLSWDAFDQLNLQKKYIKMHVVASKDTQADYKEQFKIGQRSLLDLLDTENELYQARRDFLEAEFSEVAAQYRIMHAMGLLLKALKVTLPTSWSGENKLEGGITQ